MQSNKKMTLQEAREQQKKFRDRKRKLFQGYLAGCLDTVKNAAREGKFEDLRTVQFGDDLPTYANGNTIAYYQLRYAVGYAFEYYIMYRIVLNWLQLDNLGDISVVSFGCGSGLDRYSLQMALADDAIEADRLVEKDEIRLDRRKRRTNYYEGIRERWLGVDIVKWGKPESVTSKGFPAHENVIEVLPDGATGFFKKYEGSASPCPYQVFFFPRILSELDDDVINELCEAIRATKYARDSIVLCISNRADVNGDELRNVRAVLAAFGDAGYTGNAKTLGEGYDLSIWGKDVRVRKKAQHNDDGDERMALYGIKNETGGSVRISEIAGSVEGAFAIQGDIRKYLKARQGSTSELAQECVDAGGNCKSACKADGPCKSNCPLKNPVSTTSQMNFQIIELSRV